ncbi:hypothetical protein TI05_15545 [Achromatium sp. WMS3]|nr:hypothetical protein TI05_15545 [Achromatium sp. WMS3]
MRILSFNVNGIRARRHQLRAIRDTLDPDILALQETKVQDDDFPQDLAHSLGYHVEFYGQKSHYGVAIFSKQPPLSVEFGFPNDPPDSQRRVIIGEFAIPNSNSKSSKSKKPSQSLTVINSYFPQGASRDHPTKFPHKQQFYADMLAYISNRFKPKDQVLLVGDMNVAPSDLDIGIGTENATRWLRTGKCAFLPEEREWLQKLITWGFTDTFREQYPQINDRFSWFDYRSRGFEDNPRRGLRIDLILATASLVKRCQNAAIDYAIRGLERPSDHCPVWIDLDL